MAPRSRSTRWLRTTSSDRRRSGSSSCSASETARTQPAPAGAGHAGAEGRGGSGRFRRRIRGPPRWASNATESHQTRRTAPAHHPQGAATIDVELTAVAERQPCALRGRRAVVARRAVEDLLDRGCMAAGHRLAGDEREHICCRHLYGNESHAHSVAGQASPGHHPRRSCRPNRQRRLRPARGCARPRHAG